MQSIQFRIISMLSVVALFASILLSFTQQNEPWSADQLLNPSDLAATLNDPNAAKPVVICVGPGAVIPNSIDVGPTSDKANLEKLKTRLKEFTPDTEIVIYCGCCPFNKCPNVRPAFILLNSMGFKRHKLLNLSRNIKSDWIDQGYPVAP